MKYYLAIDIGASSGRLIVGYKKDSEYVLDEIYRFREYLVNENDDLVWNIEKIFYEIKKGIKLALKKYPKIESLSIDTWGCDYVLMNGDKEIFPCYAYRNSRTKNVIDEVHQLINPKELFKINGCQFQPFNTIYQLYHDKKKGRLKEATDFLMIPEYLAYKLTGVKMKEYTNASTTGLLDINKLDYSEEIIDKLGFNKKLFKPLEKSNKVVGDIKKELIYEFGENIKVVLCESHDTASAVKSLEIKNDTLYLSSGTWSLLGIKTNLPITKEIAREYNYSNELGNDYIRFQKNIMGMWIANNLSKELMCSHSKMIAQAKKSNFFKIFDVNDDMFLSSTDIKKSIKNWFDKNGKPIPKTNRDYINCVYHSLAYSYKKSIDELSDITKKKFDKIYIIGGGANNTYLNKLTEKYCGFKVVALPIEATIIGNLKAQMGE